jgi:hypothetical protein
MTGSRGVYRKLAALLSVGAVVLTSWIVAAPPVAAADPTASLSIQKAASDSSVTPGENFTYTIQFQCTAGTVNGCVNAKVDDPMPTYITIVGTPHVSGTSNYDASASTSTELIMTFTDNLGGGDIGLAPGHVVTVEAEVHVDDDAPPDRGWNDDPQHGDDRGRQRQYQAGQCGRHAERPVDP